MINFLKFKFVYLAISLIVLAIGGFAIFSYGLDYSIDFTGGSNIDYRIDGEATPVLVQEAFEAQGGEVLEISQQDEQTYTVRTSPIDEVQETAIRTSLEDNEAIASVEKLLFETVGPSLGQETIKKTAIAAAVAVLGILIYVSFTFKKFNYGIAAVVAMLHDFLILIGMYALLTHFNNAEVDALFITAVLTTMSFSVHDTIVVFDKIREYRKTSGLPTDIIANKALTETMVRSVNNSLTIVLMLVPLVALGTDTIRFFAAALLIGTIAGTYSSPFVATPILVLLEKRK